MTNICLCYFSGTGMTKYAVDKLVRELAGHQITVDCVNIEQTVPQQLDLTAYAMLGIAYPVHALNAPKIVADFAAQLPDADGMDAFIISTAGDDIALNYATSNLLIKRLSGKGYRVFYDRLFQMPCNFATKHDDAEVKGILARLDENIPQAARDIAAHKTFLMPRGVLARVLAMILRAEWPGAHLIGRLFYAKAGCTQCGICVDGCPNRNIEFSGGSVRFKGGCGLCMRCLYSCPNRLISIHRPFKFICLDKWYDAELFD